MHTIAEIEAAIVEELRSREPRFRVCGSLAQFLLKGIEDEATLCPAAFVAYEQGSYDHRMNGVQERTMLFNVFVMTRNARGDEAARHGRGDEKGVYELLEAVRGALTGRDCGLHIDPLLPRAEQAIDGDQHFSVYGISFETRCRFAL
jgi:phage gp37-like protein